MQDDSTPKTLKKRQKLDLPKAAHWRIIDKSQDHCWYCGTDLSWDISGESYTLDHVIPLSKGGMHHESNMVRCCRSCNVSKGNKSVEEFRQHRMKLLHLDSITSAFETHGWQQ